MKTTTTQKKHFNKNIYWVLIFVALFSFSTASAQKKVKFDYKQEAKTEISNYFDIVKKKKEEIASYDLTKINDLKEYKHFHRWAEFWRIRVNADGSFPDENLSYYNAGILTADGKLNTNSTTNARNSLPIDSWTNVGPSDVPNPNGYSNPPQMGRLNCFLRIKHPSDTAQDILFVGAPNGGVWKSVDGGANWSPKLDMVAGIGVSDIKTTPDATFANYTTKPIYVSTGDWDGSHSNSIGVLKSTDGGETYASTDLSYALSDSKLTGELVVIDANTVFVGTSTGISKTINGGTTWTEDYNGTGIFNPPSNVNIGRVAISGNEIMYTGINFNLYLDDHTNANSAWEIVNNDISTTTNKKAVTVGEDGEFYIQNTSGQIKKFNGTLFANFGTIPAGYNSQDGYNQALIVKNDMLISGEFNASHSSDNGANWYRSLNGYYGPGPEADTGTNLDGTFIHSDHHGLGKLDGAHEFWSVNDGGLSYINYTSASDQKPTVDYKSSKTLVTQIYSVAINPNANDDAYLIANQDNDAYSKVGNSWYALKLGDGIGGAINYNNSDIRYASNQNATLITRSDAGYVNQLTGNYFTQAVTGVPFVHILEMDRINPNLLYINSTNGIVKITDTGSSLTNSLLDNQPTYKFNTHTDLILAVSDNNVIRAIPTNGDPATSILGAVNLINPLPAGQTQPVLESIDFNASRPNYLYMSTKGYNNGNKVFRSSDTGVTFMNVTGNLPDVIINKILTRQAAAVETIFVATNIGVYFTTNSNRGANTIWSRLGQGMPNVDVKDIEIHYTSTKLVAATFGRGLWEISIQDAVLGINEVNLENGMELSVYPNPVNNGHLNVKLNKNLTDVNYEVYNVVGGLVKKGMLNKTNQINIDGLANNIYLIRVFNNEFSVTKKFVLAK